MSNGITPDIARDLAVFADWRSTGQVSPTYGELHLRTFNGDLELFTCWNGRHLARHQVLDAGLSGDETYYSVAPAQGWLYAKKGDAPPICEADLSDWLWVDARPARHFSTLWDHWEDREKTEQRRLRVENTNDLALFGKLSTPRVTFAQITKTVTFWHSGNLAGYSTQNMSDGGLLP